MLDRLPEELCLQVALFLSAQDVLKFVILHRNLTPLTQSVRLWTLLLTRDSACRPAEFVGGGINEENNPRAITAEEQKRAYLTYAHVATLQTVRWRPVRNDARAIASPSQREGHLMCVLGDKVVLTGGFCDDFRVHILDNGVNAAPGWNSLPPRTRASFVYGASLTAIDDHRAVRFGGFRGGGYTGETNQVAVLTFQYGHHGSTNDTPTFVEWQTIVTQGPLPTARAYHSATLLHNRYLLIVGGMTTPGSILQEAILDTHTWTWLDTVVSSAAAAAATGKPSGRHGHSVVLDEKRHRLVLFGGGSGSDLLRSGTDNSQVWELKMTNDGAAAGSTDTVASMPWTWNKIYKNAQHDNGRGELWTEATGKDNDLSLVECLTLGRCHIGVKVSTDMVLLAFGSGRPTTNGLLAYNLAKDEFHRPNVGGPLPFPRFTAAAALMRDGWLLVHGGYTTQEDGTRGDTVLLDLAPGMARPSFPSLPFLRDSDPAVLTYRQINDYDAAQTRRRHQVDIGNMLMQLSAVSRNERGDVANRMLVDVIQGGGMGGRAAHILSMVANRTVVFGGAGEDDSGNDDDDGFDDSEGDN